MKRLTIDRKTVLEKTDFTSLYHELIPKFKETKPGQAIGLCPAHDDHHESLSLNTRTGAFKCFACGFKGGAIDLCMRVWITDFKTTLYRLAERAGIKTPANGTSDKTTKPRCVAAFSYMDVMGKKIYFKERYEPGRDGRSKEFFFYHLDKNGKKQKGRGANEAVPYRLHEIVKAGKIFFVEGEAKADFLASWGLAATCLDSGAKSKWHSRYNQYFAGKEIIIVPDNDTAGEGYLQTIATALYGKAKSIKGLRLPGLEEKQDILDWIKQGGTPTPQTLQACRASFLELVDKAPDCQPPVNPQVPPPSEKSAADDNDSDWSKGVRGSGHILRMYEDSQLYHDDCGVPYILHNGRLERLEVKNRRLTALISFFYYREVGKAPGREAISQAIGVLEGKALHEGTLIDIFNRVGSKDEIFFCDIGNGRVVAISAAGWEKVDKPPVFFHAFNHQHSHPEPLKGGALWRFFEFCNLPEESHLLVAVFIVASFIPRIARPVLCVVGSQGAGKSFFCGLLKTLIDPSASTLLSMPRKEEDVDLLLYRHHLVPLDNISDLSGDLSDRLSSVITGAAPEKRQLHTDIDIVLLRCNPVIVLNGIVPFIHRPDLLDRSVTINFERISPEKRQTGSELWQQFNEARPSILGGIFDALAKAMEIYPTITLKSLPRLADFARWGFAIAEALGGRGHEFMRALSENANLQTEELIEGNTFFAAIMHHMENENSLSGTFKTIFEALKETASPSLNDRTFPSSPRAFRKHLERIRIPLEDMNIVFKIGAKSRQGKLLEFSKKGSAPAETTNDTPETPRDDSGDLPF